MSKLQVSLNGASYDLSPVAEAVKWAYDLMQGMDVMNAAKNCLEMRESPLTSQLEQAVSLLEEMEAAQTETRGVPFGPDAVLRDGKHGI